MTLAPAPDLDNLLQYVQIIVTSFNQSESFISEYLVYLRYSKISLCIGSSSQSIESVAVVCVCAIVCSFQEHLR